MMNEWKGINKSRLSSSKPRDLFVVQSTPPDNERNDDDVGMKVSP